MAVPVGVNNVTVTDGYGRVGANVQAQRIKVVKFYIGQNGPFTLQFALGDFTPDKVTAQMQEQVATLQAIGAVTS
jgi:hypothetical protein